MVPSQEVLVKLFSYDETTGELVRKTGRSAGKPVNVHNGAGKWRYPQIRVLNKTCYYHRVVFMHQKGYLPDYIDHVDGNKLNTRIENLKETTSSENCRRAEKPARALPKGVYLTKNKSRFTAFCSVNGRNRYLGTFDTAEEAAAAYRTATTPVALRELLR